MQTQRGPALPRWPAQQKWEELPGCRPRHFAPLLDLPCLPRTFRRAHDRTTADVCIMLTISAALLRYGEASGLCSNLRGGFVNSVVSFCRESDIPRVDDSPEASRQGSKPSLKAVTGRGPAPLSTPLHVLPCSKPWCPLPGPFPGSPAPPPGKPRLLPRIQLQNPAFKARLWCPRTHKSSPDSLPGSLFPAFPRLLPALKKIIVSPQSAVCPGYHARGLRGLAGGLAVGGSSVKCSSSRILTMGQVELC